MPNRRVAPPLKEIEGFSISEFNTHYLDNGIPVYEINKGTQEIIKLEIVFRAGRWYEEKKLVAKATAALLKEGTEDFSSAEIAEKIDFLGGTLRSTSNLDTSSITLFCLTKHFPELVKVLQNILSKPQFPSKELETFCRINKERLKIDLNKNEVVAYRQMTSAMYGDDHPYGYNSNAFYYDQLVREDLKQHFQKFYNANNCHILISGRTNNEIISVLNKQLGSCLGPGKSFPVDHSESPYEKRNLKYDIPGSVQSAVRIGRKIVSRKHPDYTGLFVMNTILGGYFGSRLMSNLRERRGYTYGVYSTIDSLLNSSYLYVATEVASEVTDHTIEEVYKEFRDLRERPVEDLELQRVRNYIMGILLNSLDGPFNIASVIKTFILEGIDITYFNTFLDNIKTIQPEEIQRLANEYLREEDFYQVVVF